MKSSHYQTPRTLNDAVFISSADPIQTFSAPSRGLGFLFTAAGAVISAIILAILV